jgi:hypothetical protein
LSISIINDVINIGSQAFNGCDLLEEITFGEKVTTIGESAVSHCDNLNIVNLPSSLISIEGSAFYNCKNITDVYYNGTQEQWNLISIDGGNDNLVNANIHFIDDKTTTYPFCFSNSLTNQNGEIITRYNIGDITKVKMTLSKQNKDDHTGIFFIAFYDANHRLIYANYKSSTITKDADEVEIDIIDDVSSACKIKAFAWKDLLTIEPLCKTIEEVIN